MPPLAVYCDNPTEGNLRAVAWWSAVEKVQNTTKMILRHHSGNADYPRRKPQLHILIWIKWKLKHPTWEWKAIEGRSNIGQKGVTWTFANLLQNISILAAKTVCLDIRIILEKFWTWNPDWGTMGEGQFSDDGQEWFRESSRMVITGLSWVYRKGEGFHFKKRGNRLKR